MKSLFLLGEKIVKGERETLPDRLENFPLPSVCLNHVFVLLVPNYPG